MQLIPFKEPGAWEAQIELSGVIYNLSFKWNALNEYWVMNILNRNAEPVLLGVKVVVNWNLTGQFVIVGMPPGNIVCQNVLGTSETTDEDGNPIFTIKPESFTKIQRFDMGNVSNLFYYEEGELEDLSE